MDPESFGDLIRRRRQVMGLSQAKLAELMGRTPSTIRSWERNLSAPTDHSVLRTLATVLGLPDSAVLAPLGLTAPEPAPHKTIDEQLSELRDDGRFDEAIRPAAKVPAPDRSVEVTTVPTRPAPPPAPAVPAPTSAPSYLEIPTERMAYQSRAVLTAAVGFGLLLLLMWALSELRVGIGEVWSSLTGG